jgi:hypothetical protein
LEPLDIDVAESANKGIPTGNVNEMVRISKKTFNKRFENFIVIPLLEKVCDGHNK